jgi:hypothetical protein
MNVISLDYPKPDGTTTGMTKLSISLVNPSFPVSIVHGWKAEEV